jgi:hypothetical protein
MGRIYRKLGASLGSVNGNAIKTISVANSNLIAATTGQSGNVGNIVGINSLNQFWVYNIAAGTANEVSLPFTPSAIPGSITFTGNDLGGAGSAAIISTGTDLWVTHNGGTNWTEALGRSSIAQVSQSAANMLFVLAGGTAYHFNVMLPSQTSTLSGRGCSSCTTAVNATVSDYLAGAIVSGEDCEEGGLCSSSQATTEDVDLNMPITVYSQSCDSFLGQGDDDDCEFTISITVVATATGDVLFSAAPPMSVIDKQFGYAQRTGAGTNKTLHHVWGFPYYTYNYPTSSYCSNGSAGPPPVPSPSIPENNVITDTTYGGDPPNYWRVWELLIGSFDTGVWEELAALGDPPYFLSGNVPDPHDCDPTPVEPF